MESLERIRSVFTKPLTSEEISAGFDSNVNIIIDVHYRDPFMFNIYEKDEEKIEDGKSYNLSKEGGTFNIPSGYKIYNDTNIKVYTRDRTIASGRYFPVKFASNTFIGRSKDYVLIQLETTALFILVSAEFIFEEIKNTIEPVDMWAKNIPYMQTVFKYRDEFLKICSPE